MSREMLKVSLDEVGGMLLCGECFALVALYYKECHEEWHRKLNRSCSDENTG